MYGSRASRLSDGRSGETYELLSSRRTRRVLSVLSERPEGLSLAELAAEIADTDAGTERVRASLHHRHLPKLDEAALAEYDGDEVRPGDRVFEDDLVGAALSLEVDPETGDTVFELLAADRRRTILELLATGEEYAVSDLASVLAASSETTRRDAEISLVHNHLPKLERAGAVEFDADAGEVRYRGFPSGEETLERLLAADDGSVQLASGEGDLADADLLR